MQVNELAALDRPTLAALAREYMLTSQVNDRAGMAAVRLHPAGLDFATVAIAEWMAASPVYTRRLQQRFGFEGSDVSTIFKGLQLDSGFTHQYFGVNYRVDAPDRGRFWLTRCGALDDVVPFGDDLVHSMCHTIEDPTFDATAVATNRRAQVRPVHRPPHGPGGHESGNACEWTVVIDPTADPVADHPRLATVAATELAALVLDDSISEHERGADDGMDTYDGDVMELPSLEAFSAPALVALCKEFVLQSHLLARSLALEVTDTAGPEVAAGVLESEMIGSCWLMSERLARFFDVAAGDGGLDAIEWMLPLHPALLLAEYQPFVVERDADTITLRLFDGPARRDGDASWFALLWSGRCAGLEALVQAIDRRAVVTPLPSDGDSIAWTITVDPEAEPAPQPMWADIAKVSTISTYEFTPGVPVALRTSGA